MNIHDRDSSGVDVVAATSLGRAALGIGDGLPVPKLGATRPVNLPTGSGQRPPVPGDFAEPVDSESRFDQLLRREKRRSERSRAPLALVLFRATEDTDLTASTVDLLFDELCGIKRETDVLHCFPPDALAVLCPYTDEHGAHAFVLKMQQTAAALSFVVSAATYPGALFEALVDEIRQRARPIPFAPFDPTECGGGGYPLKRLFDIIGSVIALVLLAPLMLVVAAAIRLTSPGPAIFRQTRLGRGGVPFTFYKFRSMTTEAQDRIHRDFVAALIRPGSAAIPAAPDGSKYAKLRGDPRVTKLGRLLRKTSIDELPQFFNVLRGDMSIVGPRPPIPYETDHYQFWHLRRILTAKPGITGLWQVEGRSRVTFDEMVRMDLRYTRTCSLSLDTRILFKTVGVVILGTGAG